ncbi:MAG: cell division protein FtsA [Spirochaetota bacterium]|nr:cell division protein FtsA [Spirochaetota bacterium]
MENRVIVGLDIGTTKVCAVIGQKNEYNELMILGVGVAPSYGLRRGVIVNIDSTTDAITHAVEEAELMAGVDVTSMYIGITGNHIKGMNSRGVIAVSSKNREVTDREVERVIEAAQAINLPTDKEIIHVIPWEFIIDEQDGIKDPYGMSGVRLEVDAHIVTGASTAIQNITKSVKRAGFDVQDFVLNSLASAEAVLTDDEKEIGIILLDIGGGTTDAILFVNGSIRYSAVFPVGGKHITKDISIGLKIPDNVAEKIKLENGCSSVELINPDAELEIPSVGGRKPKVVPYVNLCQIIEPRVEEIIDIVYRDMVRKNVLDLAQGGVVITGGTALLNGIEIVAEKVFNLPVRTALPENVSGLKDKISSPVFSTAAGLVLYGLREESVGYHEGQQQKNNIFKRMKNSISEFTKEFFA